MGGDRTWGKGGGIFQYPKQRMRKCRNRLQRRLSQFSFSLIHDRQDTRVRQNLHLHHLPPRLRLFLHLRLRLHHHPPAPHRHRCRHCYALCVSESDQMILFSRCCHVGHGYVDDFESDLHARSSCCHGCCHGCCHRGVSAASSVAQLLMRIYPENMPKLMKIGEITRMILP